MYSEEQTDHWTSCAEQLGRKWLEEQRRFETFLDNSKSWSWCNWDRNKNYSSE